MKPTPPQSLRRFVNVLFLSTGGAARAPIAEAAFLWLTRGRAAATSAGMAPSRDIHPMARVAVRNVFNGQIAHGQPRAVPAAGAAQFDVVFTLSPEAAAASTSIVTAVTREHWALEDPATAPGTRIQRQHVFDRVTRDILKRLRAWWRAHEASTRPDGAGLASRRRGHVKAQWRTRPAPEAPLLVVAYYGPMRSCVNMCALLERSGFQLLCGDQYGRTAKALPVLPSGVIVRVDGSRLADDRVRPEFRAVTTLRRSLGTTPMVMLVDRIPSPAEHQILRAADTQWLQRKPQNTGRFLNAIQAFVHQSPVTPVPPTVAVAYFGPQQRCAGMCAQFERSGIHVLCGEEYGRTPTALSVVPDGVVVRIDGERSPTQKVRPEFRALQRIRGAFGDVPILMLGDHIPAAPEQEVLQACDAHFINRRTGGRNRVMQAVDDLVSHRPHS